MVFYLALVLFAGVVCEGKYIPTCGKDEFPCNDGSCILKTLWCDAELNCKDHSDERFCFLRSNLRPTPNDCDETFFMCRNGPCIPLEGRCDGYPSCRDGSDEEGCPTEISTEIHTESKPIVDFQNNPTEYPVTGDFTTFIEHYTEGSTEEDHGDVQADSGSSKKNAEDKNLEKGFKDIDPNHFGQQKLLAAQWLISVRDKDYGWGDETPRALTALYMSDFLPKQEEKMLMSKQLQLQLFTALIRNTTSPIPLWDLSLFINALSASCSDPRNFYGQDLVEILRHRTDRSSKSSTSISPLVYLTLCLNGATTDSDVAQVIGMQNYTQKINKIGTGALVSLTATCISRMPKFSSYKVLRQIPTELYSKVVQHGLPESIYKLALVTQALNEAHINQNFWNRSHVLRLITNHQGTDGSFGDILSTYYTMPILSGRSLLSLRRHCNSVYKDSTHPEVFKDEYAKVYVKYSLMFGDPLEVSQTLMIKVNNLTNVLDIMRMAETINPVYRFKYDMNEGKPEVYSIGGIVNDPERGLYWKLHVHSHKPTGASNLSPYEGDIRNYKLKEGDSIAYWIKPLY